MHKVFLDSDVIISSLLSSLGASYQLINNKNAICFISDISYRELILVSKKLNLDESKLKTLTKEKLKVIKLRKSLKKIKSDYENYIKDLNDAHVIAGAVQSKAGFLITYNIRHFEINKIKEKYRIQIMTPGNFLQYLRSKQF